MLGTAAMMLKLYRTTERVTEYWEAWEDTPTRVIVHWGKIGEKGDSRKVSVKSGTRPSGIIKREAEPLRAAGFKTRRPEEHAQIVIQYKLEGWGSGKDHDRRVQVENLMNECLGWTGLGHCDGGDIGSGTMNVFCDVVDAAVAALIVVSDLRENGQLEGAVIAARERNGDDEYKVLWPEGFAGTFDLL
ncbi:MAG: hypothetical protein ABR924_03125 [Terracidiphilus sp.]|jgi:hypothetical protein